MDPCVVGRVHASVDVAVRPLRRACLWDPASGSAACVMLMCSGAWGLHMYKDSQSIRHADAWQH